MWIIVAGVVWLLFWTYMAIRNQYVYRYSMWVLNDETRSLEERLDRAGRLPDYHTMWWQVFTWHWDVD